MNADSVSNLFFQVFHFFFEAGGFGGHPWLVRFRFLSRRINECCENSFGKSFILNQEWAAMNTDGRSIVATSEFAYSA